MGWYKKSEHADARFESGSDVTIESGATLDVKAGGALKIGGVTVTLTAAEMNILHDLGLAGTGGFFDHTFTTAEIKAQNGTTNLLVPAITGKQFFPVYAAMCAAGGNAGGATTVRLAESTTAGVVLSHVVADMTSGTWVGPTGGTVVTTKLETALTVSEGITIIDAAANSLTTCTSVRAVVAGYYI
jgi:hypothetical protein